MSIVPPARRGGTVGAAGLVLVGLICQDIGAASAVTLFPQVGALGMVALRLAFSAIILMAVFRPRMRGRSRADWFTVIAFGLALALMNGLFYEAIARVPLGTTVTIEVLGPLILSVVVSRKASAWLWAVLAFAGVAILGWGGWDELDPVGVAFACAAGVMWVCYILLSARTGRRFERLDGLAIAMSIGAIVTVPLGVSTAGPPLFHASVLLIGVAVAMLSSAIPYGLELLALRRLPAATFSILMSLSPALAATAGLLILHQALTVPDAIAIVLVVVASMGAVRAAALRERDLPPHEVTP